MEEEHQVGNVCHTAAYEKQWEGRRPYAGDPNPSSTTTLYSDARVAPPLHTITTVHWPCPCLSHFLFPLALKLPP